MKRNVLVSLLAVGAVPTAALADAPVAVTTDQASDWTTTNGNTLQVNSGNIIYSPGSVVTRNVTLKPGKYSLSAQANNATVTAVVGDKEYALDTEFELKSETTVTIKAVTKGEGTTSANLNEFTFGEVKFTLKVNAKEIEAVEELNAQLAQALTAGDAGLGSNDKWKEGGTLAKEGSDLGDIIRLIENCDYDTYCKYELWNAANSSEIAKLKENIEAFAKKVNAEVESQKAYDSATVSLSSLQQSYKDLTDNEWAKADKEYTQNRNQTAYDKLGNDLKSKLDELAKAYEDGTANSVELEQFIKDFNEALNKLKTAIAADDADAAAWDRVNAISGDALTAYNEVNVTLGNLLKADNYKAMLTEAQTALRAQLETINNAKKSNGETRASEQSAKNESANTEALNNAISAIKDLVVSYQHKYETSEANKTAADEVVKGLTEQIEAIKQCTDVTKEYAKDIEAIEKAISDLTAKNGEDYASPYAMASDEYTVNDGSDIQSAIDKLTGDSKETLDNYNAYQALIKNTLQAELDKAKEAVGKLDSDAYNATNHFAATAGDLQKTVTDITNKIDKAYKEKTAATLQTAIEAEITNAQEAIKQYQTDATDAQNFYTDISKAVKGYNESLDDLKKTATDGTARVGENVVTTVAGTGATYGERISTLEAKTKEISDSLVSANKKLDAEHLAALKAIVIVDSINVDAKTLKENYSADKKQSDAENSVTAAQGMWKTTTDFVGVVQKAIDTDKASWLEGNEDGQLGLKYKEITDSLNKLQDKLTEQNGKIPAYNDITAENASDYYATLSQIYNDVDAIKKELTALEKAAKEQIEKVKAENAAQKKLNERNDSLTDSLTKTIAKLGDFNKVGEIESDVDSIKNDLDKIAADIKAERDKENLCATSDSITARQDAVEKAIKDLNTKIEQFNNNKTAKEELEKQLTEKGFFTTDTGMFATAEKGIKENTDGTNEEYYLGLIDGWSDATTAKGKYAKEYYDIVEAINKAYANNTADAEKEKLQERIDNLARNVGALADKAKDDNEANKILTERGTEVQDFWNETNTKLNASDLNQSTVQPYIDKLNAILPDITAENEKVEDYYKNGQSADSLTTAKGVYDDISQRIKEISDFINGGDDFNAAIAGDNLDRWNAYVAMRDSAQAEYDRAKELIAGYLGVQNAELKADLSVIINGQKDIYGYYSLIADLDKEARNSYNATISPAVWDKSETYKEKAKTYRDELSRKITELARKVNVAAKQLLAEKLTDLKNKLDAANETVADYEQTVKEGALSDVQEFYDKVAGDDYANSQALITNLDKDWSTFDKIDEMIAADLEQAAQDEWDKLYNGLYSDYKDTDNDRYQGAKKTYEEQLAALQGYEYDDPAKKQANIDAYEQMVEETLKAAITAADEAEKAGNMADAIDEIKALVKEFFNSPIFSDAKTEAENWAANVDAYNTLTADYATVQARLDAVKAYYEAYYYANATFDDELANAQALLDGYKETLKKTNASAELEARKNGVVDSTLADGEKWYNHDIINEIINNLYKEANQREISGLFKELADLDSEKDAAIEDCYSKNNAELAQKLQAKYDELQPALYIKLDSIHTELNEKYADQDSLWQKNGLLALEKEIAKARAEFSALWKTGLAADVLSQLLDAINDAEESYNAANDAANVYEAVAKKYADELAAEKADIDKLKDDVQGYGSEIGFYSDKVLEKVKEIEEAIKSSKEGIDQLVKLYDAHTTKYNELKAQNEAIQTEYNRVKDVIGSFQHSTMQHTWEAWNEDTQSFDTKTGTWNDYYAGALAFIQKEIEVNNTFLAKAEEAAKGSDTSALLTDDSALPHSDESVESLARIERTAYGNEAKLIYLEQMTEAYQALASAIGSYNNNFSCEYTGSTVKPSKMILDEDGTLQAEWFAIAEGNDNVGNYNNSIYDIFNATVDIAIGINGEDVTTTDENGDDVLKTVNYVLDADGYKLVITTAQDWQARAEALLSKIQEAGFMKGDVNGDGSILMSDYLAAMQILLGGEQPEDGTTEQARTDVNSDGVITISDITLIATKATTGEWPSGSPVTDSYAKAQGAEKFFLSTENSNETTTIAINLSNHKDYVAGQLDVKLPAGMTLVSESLSDRANGHELYSNDLADGTHRIVVSTIENNTFNAGEALIYLEVQGKGEISVDNIIFCDAYGKETHFQTIGSTTGINGVEGESSLKQKIYSVGGQIMNGIKKGINIIRNADGSTTKVIKK